MQLPALFAVNEMDVVADVFSQIGQRAECGGVCGLQAEWKASGLQAEAFGAAA